LPNPTYSAVHVSTPLTNISVARFNANRDKYRARIVFPAVGVMKQADKYFTYDAGDLRRSQATRRGPGAEASVGGYKVSTDPYSAERWSVARDIDDPTRDNADPQFNLDAEATEFVTDQNELALENQWTSEFFTTATWSGGSGGALTDQTGVAAAAGTNEFLQWNDVASEPIEVIRAECLSIESNTGYKPRVLTLGARVWSALADHPDLLDRIKHTQTGVVTTALLASVLELDNVVVLGAVINTGNEGAADSVDFIAGKHALLTYSAPAPGLRTPTAGYTFVWTAGGRPVGGSRMKRYRLERNESDRIEGEVWADFKQVSADLGAFLASAVA